ncbi:glycohydrolase toxin TNT-related protein [Schaalia hyovaginalis]|uniref:TNT domain-containing protein n=1 Tax=Schaalia hyovaginalis TaxID=29316 RepID=A0A923E074_9ACTO|nr:glycohydrolase toxin TNT-related protein [Schaalia hyovaginalis]MBB6333489.1 hypothetical protein [Schaalia hyovaginalis]MDY2669016.1 glycohydrolase toxin TNT-related protein [Schaalia hyovaginalis]
MSDLLKTHEATRSKGEQMSHSTPNVGLIRWPGDDHDHLMGMLRRTIEEFSSLSDYVARYGPHVDRIGEPTGKYFCHLPANGNPCSFESRSLDPFSLHSSYYQYTIDSLPESVHIRTGITAPWHGFEGGARGVQFIWGNIPLTAIECIELGILAGKVRA